MLLIWIANTEAELNKLKLRLRITSITSKFWTNLLWHGVLIEEGSYEDYVKVQCEG